MAKLKVEVGEILCYIGEETEAYGKGEEVEVIAVDPKNVTIKFDDGGKKTIKHLDLTKEWTKKQIYKKTEKQEDEKFTKKPSIDPEVARKKTKLIELCEEKGCEIVEQVPFIAIKYEGKTIVELFKSKSKFSFNVNEKAFEKLPENTYRDLGYSLGHKRTNDFRIINPDIDETINALIDLLIDYSVKREKEIQEHRKNFSKKMKEARKKN